MFIQVSDVYQHCSNYLFPAVKGQLCLNILFLDESELLSGTSGQEAVLMIEIYNNDNQNAFDEKVSILYNKDKSTFCKTSLFSFSVTL